MIDLDLLAKVEAFKALDPAFLAMLQPHCELLTYHQQDKLFTEGDEARHLWSVVEGQVDLRFEMPDGRPADVQQTVSSVQPQQTSAESRTMGWSCFVPPFKMRLSAYCVSPAARIVRVSKKVLLDLFDQQPEMGYQFMTYMITVVGFRFHQFQDEVARNMGERLMYHW